MRSAISRWRSGCRLAAGAVQADDVVEQRAGRRLPALGNPAARQPGAIIGSPAAGKGPLVRRHRHHAGGRAGDQREVPVELGRFAGEAAEHAERPGIGVDDAGRDAAVSGQPELGRGFRGEGAEVGADGTCRLRQAASLQNVIQPDLGEEIALPARRLMRQIGPFAGQRALRARQRSRRARRQVIGEVEHVAGFVPAFRQAPLQPHQLRRRHFRRHHAAEIVEHAVAGISALVGFGQAPGGRARRSCPSASRRSPKR